VCCRACHADLASLAACPACADRGRQGRREALVPGQRRRRTLAAGGGAAWFASSCAIAHRRGPLPAAPMPRTPPQHDRAVTRHGSRAPRAGRADRHAPHAPIAGRKVTAPGRNATHCPGWPLQPSGPDGEGQAEGPARLARGEPLNGVCLGQRECQWVVLCTVRVGGDSVPAVPGQRGGGQPNRGRRRLGAD
jgi:hypothetical protein